MQMNGILSNERTGTIKPNCEQAKFEESIKKKRGAQKNAETTLQREPERERTTIYYV